MSLTNVQIVDLPKVLDRRGNLSIIEQFKNIPFKIERVFWIYDVPGGESRGGHAYYESEEFIVALSGSFDVTVNDGKETKTYSLNRSYYGLYIPKKVWREFSNFSTNSVALVLSSTKYSESDYIRNKRTFLNLHK